MSYPKNRGPFRSLEEALKAGINGMYIIQDGRYYLKVERSAKRADDEQWLIEKGKATPMDQVKAREKAERAAKAKKKKK